MTLEEASKATGYKFSSDSPDEGSDCALASSESLAGLFFMTINGTISRIDIDASGYATSEGAKVGDSEATIKKIYAGRVEIEPHKYIDGHYLNVYSPDKQRAIVFETDGKKVTQWRIGKIPEVQYVEGCS
jgi:hypothetical protein